VPGRHRTPVQLGHRHPDLCTRCAPLVWRLGGGAEPGAVEALAGQACASGVCSCAPETTSYVP
jgi:hypothetical protein